MILAKPRRSAATTWLERVNPLQGLTITGGGVFSTAEQARTQTVLRGDAEIGPDVSFAVNAELRVEPERVAAFAGHAVTIRGGSDLVLVGATTEQLEAVLAHVSLLGDAKGRVHLELPGEGEHVYNGPFETGKLVVSAPAGSVITTDPLTDTLLGQIFAASRNGAWYVGGDPSAASTIGNTYYRGHIVLRDAGDVRVDSWICASSNGRSNVKPDRLGLRGETRLTASGIYAGRGFENGCGIVEIEDGAEAAGTFWVGRGANERGGLQRIAKVSTVVVPFMAVFYLIIIVFLLLGNLSKIPSAIELIVRAAFNPSAFTGGMVGTIFIAMQKGIARGIFSNEAGLGSAP